MDLLNCKWFSSSSPLVETDGEGHWLSTLWRVEFHLFLIALSVLPGSCFAISAHLFPFTPCSYKFITNNKKYYKEVKLNEIERKRKRKKPQ